MKSTYNKLLASAFAILTFTACNNDDDTNAVNPLADTNKEYEYVRVLTADGTSSALTQIKPADGSVLNLEGKHPNASLYATASGRYAAVLYNNQNLVEFFDTGLESHGEHVDVKGTPKFASISGDGNKPTHYKSKGDESIVFNDGDGTLSIAKEADFHVPGAKMQVINAGLAPHHGAMVKFDNGNYGVTLLDNASALPGPHGVKIINATGNEVFASSLPTSRIHGNATDGTNALFGAEGGVLVVTQTGEQRLILNPADFGTVRAGTILYAAEAKKFLAYTNLKGVYSVDLAANKMTPLFESTEIMQCKVDKAGKNLLVLLLDGTLKVYDLSTGKLTREGKVITGTAATETLKPVLEASTKFAYITQPASGEVHQVLLTDFSQVNKIKVSGQPTKLAILGFETSESH